MSRKIKTWRDPYGEGFNICKKREIEIEPGLTVLVGCNGAGKTTMLHNVAEELKNENIPVFQFDNTRDGGFYSIDESIATGNYSFGATAMCSSEGENINMNLGKSAAKWRRFIETGDDGDRTRRLVKAVRKANGEEDDEKEIPNERWILLDAVDSGFSVDNVVEMKDLFRLVMDDAAAKGIELYIVVSANEYELAAGEACFDVIGGKYVRFGGYDEYREFVLKTRKEKDKRYKGK